MQAILERTYGLCMVALALALAAVAAIAGWLFLVVFRPRDRILRGKRMRRFLFAFVALLFLTPALDATISIGGPSFQGVEAVCDFPPSLWMKNVGGRDGAGLCVFTSIQNSARWQNELRLWNFQADMRREPGGGYPDKVDKMIAKYGPGTQYIQSESGDASILEAALKTGRMPGVTYAAGRDDPHYHQTIAHMVNLVYLDDKWACILDNNFPPDQLEWMPRDTFLSKWKANGGGWLVVLLSPPPPPVPRNKQAKSLREARRRDPLPAPSPCPRTPSPAAPAASPEGQAGGLAALVLGGTSIVVMVLSAVIRR